MRHFNAAEVHSQTDPFSSKAHLLSPIQNDVFDQSCSGAETTVARRPRPPPPLSMWGDGNSFEITEQKKRPNGCRPVRQETNCSIYTSIFQLHCDPVMLVRNCGTTAQDPNQKLVPGAVLQCRQSSRAPVGHLATDHHRG